MSPPFDRRDLLKLAGASAFALGGTPTGVDAQSEESEVIETELVRVAVPTTAEANQRFIEELAREGDLYAQNVSPALRDKTENTLDATEVFGVDRSGNTVGVRRRLETSASTLDSTLTVTVPEGVPGAVIGHTVENVGEDTVELNTPGNFRGTDIGLGEAKLASPSEEYRFSVQGGDPISYDDVIRWETFDLPEPRAWATSLDDERAVTYGLDGPSSASDPKLAMTEAQPPNQIRLFGTLVILEPGESATWRTAAVAHDGGDGAPARGGNLVDAAFEGESDPPPGPEFSITVTEETVDPGDIVGFVLDGADEADVSVEWAFGDGTTATGRRVIHSYDDSGEYTVEATTTSEVRRSLETTLRVVDDLAIVTEPEAPTVDDSIRFRGVGLEGTGEWELGDGTGFPANEFVYGYDEPGEYRITLTDRETGDSTETVLEVAEVPIRITDPSLSPDRTLTTLDTAIDVVASVRPSRRRTVGEVTATVGDVTVEAERVDQSVPDAPPTYLATVEPGDLSLEPGPTDVSVSATTDDGEDATAELSLPIYRPGPNLERIAENTTLGSDDIVQFENTFYDVDFEIDSAADKVPDNLPWIDTTLVRAGGTSEVSGWVNLDTGSAALEREGGFGVNVVGVGGELQTGYAAAGVLDLDRFVQELAIQDLWAALLVAPRSGPKLKLKVPDTIPKLDEITVEFDARLGTLLQYDEFDPVGDDGPEVVPADGFLDAWVPLRATGSPISWSREVGGGANDPIAEPEIAVELSLGGDFHVATDASPLSLLVPFPFPLTPTPEGGAAALEGGITVNFAELIKFKPSISDLADATPGFSQPAVTIGNHRKDDEPDWRAYDGVDIPDEGFDISLSGGGSGRSGAEGTDAGGSTGGDQQPRPVDLEPSLIDPTGPSPPADALSPGTDATRLARLTDRDRIDASPALATAANRHIAVWVTHREGAAAADGRALAVADRSAGGDWTDPDYLTDPAEPSAFAPAIAATDTRSLVAYGRIDPAAVNDTDDLASYVDLAVRIDTGDGRSDPIQLPSDTDRLVGRPAVASLSDTEWLVAWELSDDDATAVRYAVVADDGTVSRESELAGATTPAVASLSDAVALAYQEPADGLVRRDRITTEGRSSRAEYEVGPVEAVTVSAGATAWLTAADTPERATLAVAQAGASPTAVSVPREAFPIRAPVLVETDWGPVVVYRASEPGNQFGRLAYADLPGVTVESGSMDCCDGDRSAPRTVVTAADPDVSLSAPAAGPAVDTDGLEVVSALRLTTEDGVGDVAAATQPFRAAYGISAEAATREVPPDGTVTLSYTLRNVGERPGTEPVRIEARSRGETVGTAEEAPLAPGETARGDLSVTVDESGTVTVIAGTNLPEGTSAAGTTEVTISTPALSVPTDDPIALDRPDSETATATIPVRNAGPIPAPEVELKLASDGEALARTAVGPVAADDTGSVEVTFDPADLGTSETVVLDPDRQVPDSAFARRATPVTAGQPDLTVDDSVEYTGRGGAVDAELLVTNAGPAGVHGRVLAVRAGATPTDDGFGDDDLLGTTALDVPGAVDGALETATAAVPLTGVAEGDGVRFLVESERGVAAAGLPVIEDTVGPVFPGGSGDGPPALPGQDNPPRDLNGDGLYRDVNGDGQFTIADVQTFFQHRNSDPVRNNPVAFNFDGDDPAEVSVSDVQALFIDLVRGTEGVSVEDVDVSAGDVFDGDPAETPDGALAAPLDAEDEAEDGSAPGSASDRWPFGGR